MREGEVAEVAMAVRLYYEVEDGVRERGVLGVQTGGLPVWLLAGLVAGLASAVRLYCGVMWCGVAPPDRMTVV